MADIMLEAIRRLVAPHRLDVVPVRRANSSATSIRVSARIPGEQGYFINHDFQRGIYMGDSVKRWLASNYVKGKLATLEELRP